MESVLLIGASVRAAAFSAVRAGLRPTAIDLFGDRDLAAVCPVVQVPSGCYPNGLAELAAQAPPGSWMYTGAMENRPEIVAAIARDRPLWGNDADCLRRVRDPFALAAALRAAGLPCPGVREASGAPSGRWLCKPLASAGGVGIRDTKRMTTGRLRNPARPAYLQEFVDGESRAGVFVADAGGCRLLGVTRQLVGESWVHAPAFRYSGSIGPLALIAAEQSAWERLGNAVTAFAGLRGLFGIDAVMRDGVPWPVEVNPRYTASFEVIEHATGLRAVALHAQAFWGASRERQRPVGMKETRNHRSLTLSARPKLVVGKAVWYAPRPTTVPPDGPWEAVLGGPPDFDVPPAFADIPAVGQRVARGRPVLTAFAIAATVAECERQLRSIAGELDAVLLR